MRVKMHLKTGVAPASRRCASATGGRRYGIWGRTLKRSIRRFVQRHTALRFPGRIAVRPNLLGIGRAVKPNFLGIGVPKAGTTTVAHHLAQHPQISFPVTGDKELHFFDDHYPAWSPAWYFGRFERNVAVGEFTPSYLYCRRCRDAIHDVLGPDVKFIVALRNPVDRAYSHYCHAVKNWSHPRYRRVNYPVETLSFEDALAAEPDRLREARYHERLLSYFSMGLYADSLRFYFERFPRESFYINLTDDYADDPHDVLRNLCRFLGVDPAFPFADVTRRLNAQSDGTMRDDTRRMLEDRYADSIADLESLLARDLSIWRQPCATFSA